MRKITDFIINKRHLILILFIIFAIISAILSNKVVINYDMAKYLPDTSETRIGMNIMEDKFSKTKTSSFNLMFKGLATDQKTEIYNYLSEVNGVDSIEYDETENYNKDDYTLYVITVKGDADSEIASQIYNDVTTKYEGYEIYTSGDIANTNKPVLETWIIALAIGSATIILLIMCDSFVEVFLFLGTVLVAVVLNKGTNIIFPSVSNITESITTVLQLALSMDYSIMLMNRYNQEKEQEQDKVKAMKNALYHAFQSISSSSLTTIVGLLVLVFMSFKIGRDLGLVLAKGVVFSLISTFFVLPGLILMFDKWIVKTKKKNLHIKMDLFGKINYKLRFVLVPLFLIIFLGSFLLKNNLGYLYTNSETDKISDVFSENNQMAIIYKTEDEEKIAKLLSEIESDENVDELLAYSNTINEKLTYDKLKGKLDDLGSSTDIEDYLLKIIYYHYYNKDIENRMSFNEFVTFIKTKVYNNPSISNKINDETRANIERLENFITENEINKKRTASQIAQILEMDTDKINDVLIYYSAKNNNTKMGINDFIKFINKDVLTNPKYSSQIDKASLNNLNTLSKFTNKNTIQTKMTSKQMANLFGLDENSTSELYKYYISLNEITTKMSLAEFSNFVLNNVLTDSNYANSFNQETIDNLKLLSTFSNVTTIKTEMTAKQLSSLFGIDESLATKVLLFKYMNSGNLGQTTDAKTTPYDFVKFIMDNMDNPLVSSNIDQATLAKLQLLTNIMNSAINNVKYSYNELADFIKIESNTVKNIYVLYVSNTQNTTITPYQFVNFVLAHKNDEVLSGKLSNNISNLQLIQNVMNGVINNKKYTSAELSSLLNINREKMQLLYGLYSTKYVNTNTTISLKEFINFILNDVITNSQYSSNFDKEVILKLNTINGIMKGALNGTTYTASEIMGIISIFTDSIDEDTVDLLYIYHGSENNYNVEWKLTVEEFVNYLNDEILTDNRFDDFINDEMRNNIIDSKTKVQDAKDLLISDDYSRLIINTKFDVESDETFAFVQKIKDLLNNNSLTDAYIIGDSPMAYEMSQTFNNELNFITILTMIAIFIVVAITFKSILIPIILVLIIQCAVYMVMGILSVSGQGVYFISILIVQSILMGATIDYAILYTSYYLEHRKTEGIKEAVIDSYNKSIHTILTSSSILIIVTLIVANYASAIAAKICKTISQGTVCSTIIILTLLPAILAVFDKFIVKKNYK